MSDVISGFEQALKDLFPLRSQIKRELKSRTGKIVQIDGDLIDSLEKDGRSLPMLALIKQQLPADAYLFDNIHGLNVIYPYPAFTHKGAGNYKDAYGVVFGSDEWDANKEGYVFPILTATFTKDPTTWAISCKITDENDK